LKACGLLSPPKQQTDKIVVDATAGLGLDSLILAASGAQLWVIEEHPLLQQWLYLLQAQASLLFPSLPHHPPWTVIPENALSVLKHPTDFFPKPPDILYLDPMFPPRTKSAAVQLSMQLLHRLFHEQAGALAEKNQFLFDQAFKSGALRVVIKIPRLKIKALPGTPSFAHHYRSCSFVGYLFPHLT
jgi:16S rRNA (guanine1516-N2)-methyltransferase